jgi:tetratricopeptide (TPR) repeat protein
MPNYPQDKIRSTISGGIQTGPVMMGRDFDVVLPAPAPLALAQLPPLVAGFTGRERELEAMTRLLDPTEATGTAEVSAIAGLAGVGKTSLAVHAGHAARERGWFPGGVLFIDLHGYDESPVPPGQALDALLRALGISAEHMPLTAEERAALYRSVLAGITDPVLLIVDNASSEAQVQPLLPGPGPHRTVISSRHTLAGLRARLVEIAILNNADGITLLDAALRAMRPEDDRISSDSNNAERLAQICGGLPLALQITAALLKSDPTLNIGELADDLAEERNRLERLRYEDDRGMEALSVEAAFELSYRRLNVSVARLFRMLSVNPGLEVSTDSAVVLADQSFFKTRKSLAHLARAHMIEVAPGEVGHWRMHDLMRLYARRLSDAHAKSDRRDQARYRLFSYYLKMTQDAVLHLVLSSRISSPNNFVGRDEALVWLDAERSSLVAAVSMADRVGNHQVALDLSTVLFEYLRWRRYVDECIGIAAVGVDAARSLNDLHSEAGALNNLGLALQAVRRFDDAIACHRDAATLAKGIGERHTEGAALHNLGMVLEELRLFNEAITAYQQDLVICRRFGDLPGEGMTLNSLAICLAETGQLDKAIEASERAAAISRAIDDRRGEGMALINIAGALRMLGDLDAAVVAARKGSDFLREVGDRYHEALGLVTLGGTLCDAEIYAEAIAISRNSATIFQEIGDRHGEGMARGNLAVALAKEDRIDESIAADRKALDLFVETGDRYRQGTTLRNLGLTLQKAQRTDAAISVFREAAGIFSETGDRREEGKLLKELSIALSADGQFEEAIPTYQNALVLLRATNDMHEEGYTLYNLGITFREAQRSDDAVSALRAAASIFHVTGQSRDEGMTLNALTHLLIKTGKVDEAILPGRDAVAIFREIDDHKNEGIALFTLGSALRMTDRLAEAIATLQDAAEMSRMTGDKRLEGDTLRTLGAAFWLMRHADEAVTAFQAAASIFRELGDLHSERMTLNTLKKLLEATDEASPGLSRSLAAEWRA